MPVLGIGVDIVHLPRITSLISRRGPKRFAKRILSLNELKDFQPDGPDCARFLAVRFSVKEAAYKAVYPTVKPAWKEFTYKGFGQDSHSSKPRLSYHPSADAFRRLSWNFHVSVSHDGEYIIANVVVEGT